MGRKFFRFLAIFVIWFLFTACEASKPEYTDVFRLAVPDQISLTETEKWESQTRSASKALEIIRIPGSQYRNAVWSTLLSGSDQWSAVLVPGSSVGEFSKYNAVMRVANKSQISALVFPELIYQGEWYAIPYSVDIPMLIIRQDRSTEILLELSSARTHTGLLIPTIQSKKLRTGFSGEVGMEWFLPMEIIVPQIYELVPSTKSDLEKLARLSCDENNEIIDWRSLEWLPGDVITAVDRGDIDFGILWLSQIRDTGQCISGGTEWCNSVDRLISVPLFENQSPRVINAWVVPSQAKIPEETFLFLSQITALDLHSLKVIIDPLNPEGFAPVLQKSAASASSFLPDSEMDDLNRLIFRCISGEIDSSQFIAEYERIHMDTLARRD